MPDTAKQTKIKKDKQHLRTKLALNHKKRRDLSRFIEK